jgi:DNA sulfur modification protein DndC
MPSTTPTAAPISDLIAAGALFVVNHSGGKDSQAMLITLAQRIPLDQLIVIHAHLPGVEWEGTESHMRDTAAASGVPLENIFTTRANKTFFDMVRHRRHWPSPQYRQCTSDLKRGPIEKLIRKIAKERGRSIIVNCMGLRAEESAARSKQEIFKTSTRNSKAGRQWFDWLPIHNYTVAQVFETIARAGQKAHWAYDAGMTRLSCCFCIMASKGDLQTAARLNPELFAQVVALEKEIGQTFVMPTKSGALRSLPDFIAA